ncbi:MAG: hypothetical protein ACO1SV_04265 [Fimbriimonas sp.]
MNENHSEELEASRNLLREIADLCEHASLTGSLGGGAPRVVLRYNTVLARLQEADAVPMGMFEALPETASFGEIGVDAKMLASYLKTGSRKAKHRLGDPEDPSILLRLAPFVRKEDLASLIRNQVEDGTRIDMDMTVHLAPFLDQDTLADLLRDHLRPKPPTPPTPPAPPEPPAPPVEVVAPYGETLPSRVTPQEEKLIVLLERLKDPRITSEEKAELIDRVRAVTGGA